MQRKGETAFFFCTAVSERNRMNSFMSWVGGKKALREAIVARLCCSCDRYVEVFGGGAWVLFHKLPGKFEVYNDFNPNLANLYRCVRDHPEELCEELRYTLNHGWILTTSAKSFAPRPSSRISDAPPTFIRSSVKATPRDLTPSAHSHTICGATFR